MRLALPPAGLVRLEGDLIRNVMPQQFIETLRTFKNDECQPKALVSHGLCGLRLTRGFMPSNVDL